MKKVFVSMILLIVIVFVSILIATPLVNDNVAKKTASELVELPLPDNTEFAKNEWECIVEKQTNTDVKVIEHAKLTFKTDVEGDKYYIVYSWGDNSTIFHELDIRGH